MNPLHRAACLLVSTAVLWGQIPAAWQAAIHSPSAASLRGHVSFLASDLLEGRDTPSRGLDIAAEYIAAQFRRAGLEPAGNDRYFQASTWTVVQPTTEGFSMTLTVGAEKIEVPAEAASALTPSGLEIDEAPLVLLKASGDSVLDSVDSLKGKVAVLPPRAAASRSLLGRLEKLGAAAVIQPDARPLRDGASRLMPNADRSSLGLIRISGEFAQRLEELRDPATTSLRASAWREREVILKNVIGVLRGSDPALRETYVILTAHYDHVGTRRGADDPIFNGANDNASGVAAMIEAAAAVARVEPRPRRSIVFLAVFGEEKGLLGSREYANRPVFPLAQTAGVLGLEALGRTDAEDGPHQNRAALTGFGYSTITAVMANAGAALGVEVYKHEQNSDAFFTRSDNASFAEKGVPAHTLSTGYMYPDYHRAGDHWDKLDYPQMEKITRVVTLGLLQMADSTVAPKWDPDNPRIERFREAAAKLAAETGK